MGCYLDPGWAGAPLLHHGVVAGRRPAPAGGLVGWSWHWQAHVHALRKDWRRAWARRTALCHASATVGLSGHGPGGASAGAGALHLQHVLKRWPQVEHVRLLNHAHVDGDVRAQCRFVAAVGLAWLPCLAQRWAIPPICLGVTTSRGDWV